MIRVPLEHGDAARATRRAVAGVCRDAQAGPECADAAALVTSELVTNAVLHGSGDVRLTCQAGDRRIRSEVGDAEARHPRAPGGDVDVDGEGGRGMIIVGALASAWGVTDTPAARSSGSSSRLSRSTARVPPTRNARASQARRPNYGPGFLGHPRALSAAVGSGRSWRRPAGIRSGHNRGCGSGAPRGSLRRGPGPRRLMRETECRARSGIVVLESLRGARQFMASVDD